MSMLKRLFWRMVAACSLLLGLIGVVLPGLPTVPFVLLSAFAAGKGWPQFERWLLQHPQFGPPVLQWRQHGAVPRRAKWLASLMMLVSAMFIWFSSAAIWLQLTVSAVLLTVMVWLWRRPE